jgi:hypothetical protein
VLPTNTPVSLNSKCQTVEEQTVNSREGTQARSGTHSIFTALFWGIRGLRLPRARVPKDHQGSGWA